MKPRPEDDWHGATHRDIEYIIFKVARQVARNFRFDWDRVGDDLVGAGWLGACRARNLYQPGPAKFSSYAYWFVSGDVRAEARRVARLDESRSDVEVEDAPESAVAIDGPFDLDVLDHFDESVLTPESRQTLRRIIKPMLEEDLTLSQLGERFGSQTWVTERVGALRAELEAANWRTDDEYA